MKFEVRYPTGARHEVELQGTLVVLGRDPSCDLVLSDVKCSRRHAVIEAGPQGLAIRDAGSANGIYVNGRKVDRAALAAGDVVRLGEIVVKVLPEVMDGTLAMGPEELATLGGGALAPPGPASVAPEPAPAPERRPPPARPSFASAPTATLRGPIARPATVTLLAALWAASVPLYALGGLGLGFGTGLGRPAAVGLALCGLLLSLLSALMAFGTFTRRPWARVLQLVLAAAGLLLCPFALASVTLLVYLMRPESRLQFSGRRDFSELTLDEQRLLSGDGSEPAFAGTLLGAVALGVALSVAGWWWVAPRFAGVPPAADDERALADVRAVLAAQGNFRAGVDPECGVLYADLDGLLRPAEVIPGYRPEGPAFLAPAFARAERGPYVFDLAVSEPAAPAAGCPKRAFRSFRYSATPRGGRGRHLLGAPDGRVHAAADRPATFSDPTLD